MGGTGTDSQTVDDSDSGRIDRICGEYKRLWDSDTRPNLVDFLRKQNLPTVPRLMHALVALDIDRRSQAGEFPAREDYVPLGDDPDSGLTRLLAELDKTSILAPTNKVAVPLAPAANSQFADFELLEELGRGGMGIVYRARKRGNERIVAIKIMREGRFSKQDTIARFRKEAKATSELEHPNIVAVHEVGEHDGWHFMSMQLIDGPSLAELVSESGPMNPHEAAAIMHSISQAINYANSRGVLHRDLKPSNILLDKDRVPYVVDFGLVKRLGSETAITKTGHVVGTAEYLAPEMVARDFFNSDRRLVLDSHESFALKGTSGTAENGVAESGAGRNESGDRPTRETDVADELSLSSDSTHQIQSRDRCEPTIAVDVYGLGAILYTLLTGYPPHSAHNSKDVIRHVAEHDPVPPRDLNPSIPIGLDTICRKCMQRIPRYRFESANEVAEELKRFLDGKPIVTKRESWFRRTAKFLKQNKVAILIITALLAVSILTASGWLQARNNLREAKISEARSLLWSDKAGRRYKTIDAISSAADIQPGVELRDLAVWAMARTDLRVAKLLVANPNFGCTVDARFETYASSDPSGSIAVRRAADDSLVIMLQSPGQPSSEKGPAFQPAFELEMSADGKYLAAKYRRPTDEPDAEEPFRIWNVDSGTVLTSSPKSVLGVAWCFGHDKNRAAVCDGDGTIRMIDLAEDRVVHSFFPGDWLGHIALSPDGKRMAIARGDPATVDIFDVESGTKQETLEQDGATRGICWSPDGRQLATTSARRLMLWDMEKSQKLWSRVGHESAVVNVKFNHAGTAIASAGWDGKVCLWRVSDGTRLLKTRGKTWIRFRDDDQQLAGAVDDQQVGVWDVSLAPEFNVLFGHEGPNGPHFVDFSQCGHYLATAGVDGVKIWKTAHPQRPVKTLRNKAAGACRFTAAGDALIAVGIAQVHRWPCHVDDDGIEFGTRTDFSLNAPDESNAKLFDMDGKGKMLAVLESFEGRVRLFDMEDSQPANDFVDPGGIGSVSLSPDGRLLATGTWNRRANTLIWDTVSGKVIHRIASGDAHVAFAPDGKQLIVGSANSYELFDVETWECVSRIPRNGASLRGPVGFSDNGEMMAVALSHESIQLIDRASGKKLTLLRSPKPELISAICFSPDGRYIAASCESRVIHLWDLERIRSGLRKIGLDWVYPFVLSN